MIEKFVVILAGGRGERFWPQSRATRPKHLLPIVGGTPMLDQTIRRVRGIVPARNIFVITSAMQEPAVREVCKGLPESNIVSEPVGRDTAPAVALATALVQARNPEAVFAVLPADHVIHDRKAYRRDLHAAFDAAASEGVLVTLGIQPTEPATGFGYIQRGESWRQFRGRPAFHALRFVEKPNPERARAYLDSGDYLWNAGMFIWSVRAVDSALRKHARALHAGLEPVRRALAAGRSPRAALRRAYPKLDKISIDYALLEKSDTVVVIPSTFDWDDVGAWPAIARHIEPDAEGNTLRGLTLVEDGKGNIVCSDKKHLVALIGVEDLIVVHTPDATLVCPKGKAQDIKRLLKRLEAQPAGRRLL